MEALAYAAQQGGGGTASPVTSLLIPLVAMVAIFYLLLMRPQAKKQKEHQEMVRNLKKGDKVITTGGLYGEVVKVTDRDIILEVADKIHLRFQLGAIQTVREKEETEKKGS